MRREQIMLAYPADATKISKLGSTFLVQPKLDGMRARVIKDREFDTPIIVSSENKQIFFLEDLKDQLAIFRSRLDDKLNSMNLKYETELDGELYNHDLLLQEIVGICKQKISPHPEESLMQYHVFDLKMPYLTQEIRLSILHTLKTEIGDLPNIVIVPTRRIQPEGDWLPYFEDWVEGGYEGIIFRHPKGIYVDKRTTMMLKLKPNKSDLYVITAVLPGEGKCAGVCGSLQVMDKNGNVFKVGTGFSDAQRKELWERREEAVGKQLLVKHEQLTKGDVPRCAVYQAVDWDCKLYENELGEVKSR